MVIASFNCNSIRARIEVLKRWLPMANPDVVALQETKVEDKDFPAEDFQSLGYEIAFKGEKSYNGVAILSKYKFDDVFYGFDGKELMKAPDSLLFRSKASYSEYIYSSRV